MIVGIMAGESATAIAPKDLGVSTEKTSQPEEESRPAARKRELLTVTPRILSAEAQKIGAKDRDARSPGEKSLLLYDQLGRGVDVRGETQPFISGNSLVLSEITVTIDDGSDLGKDKTFADGEAAIAGISSFVQSPDGDFYMCPLKDAKTGEVFFVDDQGKEKTVAVSPLTDEDEKAAFDRVVADQSALGYELLQTAIPVEAVADAQLQAEAASIADALDDDQKKLIDPFVASLPKNDPEGKYQPPDDIDASLEKAAQQTGLPSSEMIIAALEKQFADKLPNDAARFLSALKDNGNVLLSKADFAEGMKYLGVDSSVLISQRDSLLEQRSAAAQKLAKLEEQGVPAQVLAEVQGDIDNIDAQMIMLQKSKEMWDQSEKDGNSPVDTFYDSVMNGDLDPATAKNVMDGIKTGDLDMILDSVKSLIPQIPDTKGWTPEQKARVMDYLKKGAKGMGWAALIAAALAAAGIVIVSGGVTMLGQNMGH